LNAYDTSVSATTAGAFYVNSLRNATGVTGNIMLYDNFTKEIANTPNLYYTSDGTLASGGIITMNASSSSNRQINNVFYNMIDNTNKATNGTIYSDGGNFLYDNNTNNGTHNFYVNNNSGSQLNPLIVNANGISTTSIIVKDPSTPSTILRMVTAGGNSFIQTTSNGSSGSGSSIIFSDYYAVGPTYATINSTGITTTSVNTTSDYRIKENIQSIATSEYNVDALHPVKYYNTLSKRQDVGFIAHEVQETLPMLVSGEKDGESNQSINYTGIIPILVSEIQELKMKVNMLMKNQNINTNY
jgi:hypothetical protein